MAIAGLFPGTARSGIAAAPAALASGIAAYVSESGGAEARSAVVRLLVCGMARASAADALSIVGAEGLLACVARRVSAGGTASGGQAAADAVVMLADAISTGDARVHARIAEEGPLLRALLLAVTRGPPGGSHRSLSAATALHMLSHTASWEAAARAVDALPDNDLKDVIIASVCGRWGPGFTIKGIGGNKFSTSLRGNKFCRPLPPSGQLRHSTAPG